MTQKNPKCGQVLDPTAYIHIYIYTHSLHPHKLVKRLTGKANPKPLIAKIALQTNSLEKKAQKIYAHFFWGGGGLKNGQEVVPHFFPKEGVFKVLKNPNFYSVSRKIGGGHFFQKRPMLK